MGAVLRHPDVFEQVVRERLDVRRVEAETERLVRLAEGSRPGARFSVREFLGRVRLRPTALRGSAAAMPRAAHPSGA
ncbi:MAG TPA: hypothetical protein VGR25_07685 [bacterium]|nr:hypothetical protein [bacterium]